MDVGALFGLTVLLSFCAFGIVMIPYILPRLRGIDREDAIAALVGPHAFRFIGLSFLVPGVVTHRCHQLSRYRRHMAISSRPSLR